MFEGKISTFVPALASTRKHLQVRLQPVSVINPNRHKYTRMCLCEMYHMAMQYCSYVEYNIVSTTTKFQLGKNSLLKNFRGLPNKTKIFYRENVHMKISNNEFFPNYSTCLATYSNDCCTFIFNQTHKYQELAYLLPTMILV